VVKALLKKLSKSAKIDFKAPPGQPPTPAT
jgi:hypothetical protein